MGTENLRRPVRIDNPPKMRKAERVDASTPEEIRGGTSKETERILHMDTTISDILDVMADHPDYSEFSPDVAVKMAQDLLGKLPENFEQMPVDLKATVIEKLLK